MCIRDRDSRYYIDPIKELYFNTGKDSKQQQLAFFQHCDVLLPVSYTHLDVYKRQTQRYARNIFGKENPIGKVLEYYGKNITIKGVIGELDEKKLPEKSTSHSFSSLTTSFTFRISSGASFTS